MNRRSFTKSLGAFSALGAFSLLGAGCRFALEKSGEAIDASTQMQTQTQSQSLLVSAAKHIKGGYYLIAVDGQGQVISQTKLPKRAHDTMHVEGSRVLVFARRPDTFAYEVDVLTGAITQTFTSAPERHFYGHGALSADGSLLYTSENDFGNSRGLIVVRNTHNYRVVDEFESGGIGPHQIKMMPDGKHLVIANGGINTHPDYPRIKLNVDTMSPNLAYLDTSNGQVVEKVEPPHHQQSIRHLDVNDDATVVLGVQFQGDANVKLPLVYAHKRGYKLQAMSASSEDLISMQQYTASILVNKNTAYASCPRGDLISEWDIGTLSLKSMTSLKDVAGIAKGNFTGAFDGAEERRAQVVCSTGTGVIASTQFGKVLSSRSDFMFDNHMTAINV